MKPGNCIKTPNRNQRGDALIEAMIGILLMAVIGLGLSHATARAMYSQRYLNTQNIVVSTVREALASTGSVSGYCAGNAGPAVQVGSSTSTLSLTCGKDAVTIELAPTSNGGHSHDEATTLSSTIAAGGSLVTSMNISLPASTTNASIVGGDGSMGLSY